MPRSTFTIDHTECVHVCTRVCTCEPLCVLFFFSLCTFLVLPQQHHLWFVHRWLHQGGPHVGDTDVVGGAAHRVLWRDKEPQVHIR